MITVDRVSKSFRMKGGAQSVLRDLSFEVPAGSHFGILGGKGSGKSTILKLIGGLDHPDKGKVRCRGTVSWPFGQMRFERSMSARQNIRFLCRILGERDHDRVYHELRELTGFDAQFSLPVERMKAMEQRMLTCALSLVFDFDITLLDGRPVFQTFDNAEAFQARFSEQMKRSTVVATADDPAKLLRSCRYFLVLDGLSGRMYDKRPEAIEAFRAINNIPAPEGDDGNDG